MPCTACQAGPQLPRRRLIPPPLVRKSGLPRAPTPASLPLLRAVRPLCGAPSAVQLLLKPAGRPKLHQRPGRVVRRQAELLHGELLHHPRAATAGAGRAGTVWCGRRRATRPVRPRRCRCRQEAASGVRGIQRWRCAVHQVGPWMQVDTQGRHAGCGTEGTHVSRCQRGWGWRPASNRLMAASRW